MHVPSAEGVECQCIWTSMCVRMRMYVLYPIENHYKAFSRIVLLHRMQFVQCVHHFMQSPEMAAQIRRRGASQSWHQTLRHPTHASVSCGPLIPSSTRAR